MKTPLARHVPLSLLFCTAVAAHMMSGCGEDETSADPTPTPDAGTDVASNDTSDPIDAAPTPDVDPSEDITDAAPDGDPTGDESLLLRVADEIFDRTCGGLACHTGGGQAGGLDLNNDAGLTARLLANSSAGLPHVTPGEPQNSYLFLKCDGTFREAGGSGSRMPIGAPLSADELELLRTWIETWES